MAVGVNLLSANDASFDTTIGTWVAGTNTSIARTTAQFQSSPASMRLTSAAAGAMSAFSGKYVVAASTEYEALCYAANAVAATGRIVSIKIDWYTSGDVYITSSTTTSPQTLPNSTAWSGPIVVVGISPSNAGKASVQVNVTAGITAGSQQVAVDTFGLGPPVTESGNLLPYAVSSAEMDTSDWSVSNGALTRVSTSAKEGSYSLAATSTAAGDMPVTTVARVAVTAGTAYEMYPWILPPATGRSVILDILWYDASVGGTLLGTSTQTAATVQTSIWERHTVLGAAPVGATHAAVRIRPQALGGSEVWRLDLVVLRVQPSIAGNLLPYNTEGVEVDASGWTAAGNCTVAQSAPGDLSWEGAYSLKVTATAVGPARVELAAAVPVSSDYYTATVQFHTVGPTASIVWVDIDWYDADMAWLGSAGPDQAAAIVGEAWWEETIGRSAPPGAAFAKVVLLPQATSAGQVFYLDGMVLAEATAPYVITPVASTGSVTIVLNGLEGATVSLWRVDPAGGRSPVRGYGSDVVDYPITAPTLVFEDYEAPLGVPVYYEYSDVGELRRSLPVTVDPPANKNYVWLTDPGQPGRNVLAWVEKAPSWKRPAVRGVYQVRGAALPVTVSDVRQSRQGDLLLYTLTEDEETALNYLLDTGSVLLIRARPGWGLSHIYISVGDVDEPRPVDVGWETMRRWTLPLVEVDRPVGGMAGSAGRTWQDLLDDPETPTWGDVLTSNSSWLGVLQGVD